MSEKTDIVDGWQIRPAGDGGFGVFDVHGLLEGPFGSREEAIAAALKLTRPLPRRQAEPPTGETPKDGDDGPK